MRHLFQQILQHLPVKCRTQTHTTTSYHKVFHYYVRISRTAGELLATTEGHNRAHLGIYEYLFHM